VRVSGDTAEEELYIASTNIARLRLAQAALREVTVEDAHRPLYLGIVRELALLTDAEQDRVRAAMDRIADAREDAIERGERQGLDE
jgi:hypothetical protein